jgi:NADPH2:quinone reductase
VRALLIQESEAFPVVGEIADPVAAEGEVVLDVVAAPLNPVDVSVSTGRFFGGQPPLPYVPGVEGVGRLAGEAPNGLVFACLDGLGIVRNGTCADRALVRADRFVRLPAGIDPVVAAGAGTAGVAGWSPLVRRAPIGRGDVVLVLAATGTVGLVAVQSAKLLGAERVVAVGRRPEGLERARRLGADATVRLTEQEDLATAFLDACGGVPPTYVFDPLWGEPLVAALQIAAKHARIVQLGQAAAAEASIPSGLVRGKDLDIFGYTNINLPFDALASDYLSLLDHIVAGRIRLDVQRVPLVDGPSAWRRQVEIPGQKLVLCP